MTEEDSQNINDAAMDEERVVLKAKRFQKWTQKYLIN